MWHVRVYLSICRRLTTLQQTRPSVGRRFYLLPSSHQTSFPLLQPRPPTRRCDTVHLSAVRPPFQLCGTSVSRHEIVLRRIELNGPVKSVRRRDERGCEVAG
ncbi:hypothetical protein GQ607_009302 [Colletotrichum asianum]|uniref:Uncharacterized protein n=1 Tax=Colletotrichum asianum TaxID=702518 RepID=A0A8H3WC05_9PEZI|nr:hypothetical protein GQ607_009302 [Colletotrichum asianum]